MNIRALALPLLAFTSSGCLQMSMSSGELGSSYAPWEFLTQYAFWDKNDYAQDGDKLVLKERADEFGGAILNIRLYGFTFNAGDDRRFWSAGEWRNWRQGTESEPILHISCRHADKLDDGDEVKYDTKDRANINMNDPNITVSFAPGQPQLSSGSEYPKEVKPFGSREIAKLTVTRIEENAGPGRTLAGTIEYERAKLDGDPDDVVEGKITVNFQAYVIGERLAECNDVTTEFGSFGGGGNVSPCQNLDPEGK